MPRSEDVARESYDLLSLVNLKVEHRPDYKDACRLEFSDSRELKKKTKKNDRQNTDESNSSNDFREEAFIVVSRIKDPQGSQTGYRLGIHALTQMWATL
jgi:hypothetical protein